MAAAKKAQTKKRDPQLAAAVEYFSARSHDAWRRRLLQTDPKQKGQPRLRSRGGVMVDVNQPWAKLHPNAKADNKQAARDAYEAVVKFPNDREAASDYVHKCWIKRNKHDKGLAKELFQPYAKLSEFEKDKDRAHVDAMKRAIAAVRKSAKAKARAPKFKTVRVEARQWARLERAAKRVSALTGRAVSPETLLAASLEAIVAVSGTLAPESKAKRPKSAR